MSILFNFWKSNFERSFLISLPFSSSQLSPRALTTLKLFLSRRTQILNKPLKRNAYFNEFIYFT